MSVTVEEFLRLLHALPEVEVTEHANHLRMGVKGKGFGYLWSDTETVGLKATEAEQVALVAERPEVFEVAFTAGRYGWIVVHLAKIDVEELGELLEEAWCLSAPKRLLAAHGWST
jgi:hypothetical protein